MFYVHIPQIGLIASGDSPDSAYKNLQDKQNEYFSELKKIGADKALVNELERVKELENFTKTKWPIKIFQYLLLVTLLSFALSPFIVGKSIVYNLNKFTTKIEKKIDLALNPTEEKSLKRITKFKKVMKNSSPYIKEIKKAWNSH